MLKGMEPEPFVKSSAKPRFKFGRSTSSSALKVSGLKRNGFGEDRGRPGAKFSRKPGDGSKFGVGSSHSNQRLHTPASEPRANSNSKWNFSRPNNAGFQRARVEKSYFTATPSERTVGHGEARRPFNKFGDSNKPFSRGKFGRPKKSFTRKPFGRASKNSQDFKE